MLSMLSEFGKKSLKIKESIQEKIFYIPKLPSIITTIHHNVKMISNAAYKVTTKATTEAN